MVRQRELSHMAPFFFWKEQTHTIHVKIYHYIKLFFKKRESHENKSTPLYSRSNGSVEMKIGLTFWRAGIWSIEN